MDVLRLSAIEQDALAELTNMGVSRAATSLGQMLRETILLSVPAVQIIPIVTAARFIEQSSSPRLIAVQQSFEGPSSGKALLIFPEAQSLELVRSILGDEHSIEDIINLEHEVLAETGNIILNACLSTIGNVLRQNIRMSLPSVVRGSGATLFAAREGDGKVVLFLHIRFIIRRRDLDGFIALLMDLPSIAALKVVVQDFIRSVEHGPP
jgi:chemotaxis protein CheC